MVRSGAHGRQRDERIAVDERLVMPGSGIEILGGVVLTVPGADPPHATEHAKLAYLLGAHVAPGFRPAVDMLTRTSADSDFAPDASVYPEARDATTGGRRLEVLAFEVVATQRLAVATKKARALSARGVRRIFALVLARGRVLEWDRAADRFRPMHLDERIEDASLAVPLPVRALIDVTRGDEAVLAALEVRRPDLVDRIRGAATLRTLLNACATLGVSVPDEDRVKLERASLDRLDALIETVLRTRRWPGV